MRKSIFSNSKHLQNVAAKGTFDIIQINFGKIFAHDLLRSIVYKRVNGAEFVHVLLYGILARLVIHEVAGDEKALSSLLFNHSLRISGVFFLFGEVDD